MRVEFARGENFIIETEGNIAVCRVWQRPDLTSAQGAACAEQIQAHAVTLALSPHIRGFVFDLRRAPLVAGPRTTGAMEEMARAFDRAQKTFCILTAEDAMQALQASRVLRTASPTRGLVTSDERQAMMGAARASRP